MGALDNGLYDPIINTSFTNSVANIKLVADYVFGTSAVGTGSQIAITNATILGSYFTSTQSATSTTKINSEWENYSTSFTAGNHIFNSNNLQLTGTLISGGTATVSVYGNLGNNATINTNSFTSGSIGLSVVTGISVGQILVFTYFGIYAVTSIVGSGSTATITTTPLMNSGTTINSGAFTPWQFLPCYYVVTNGSTATGGSVLNFATVPTNVGSGQYVSFYNNTSNTNQFTNNINSSQNYKVTATTGTSVTITPVLAAIDAPATGQGIVFTPPINSGQLWSQTQYSMPGMNGSVYFAMELTCQLPQNGTPYGSTVGSAVGTGSYGAWPAFWLYGGPGSGFADNSEIDVFEFYNNIFANMANDNMNIHTSSQINTSIPFLYNGSLWSNSGATYNSTTDYSQATHKFQLLVTPDFVYYFIDGIMVKKVSYAWTSQRLPQIGINLAIGSMENGLCTNNLFPVNNSNFPMTYNIYELKVWSR